MNLALQKTISLLLLIFLGFLLQKKVAGKDSLKGIKALILSVALPATIFVALLKIELTNNLLLLPVWVLALNFILLGSFYLALEAFGIQKNTPIHRTLLMLMPSLAPGLSCFPFIMEYLSEGELAMAALADVGNKIFVLIFLYLLAMHWFNKRFVQQQKNASWSKIKGLIVAMLNEPINLVMISALILLALGLNLSSFPLFLENTILRISAIMTPLVLLFIGMAVNIKWKDLNLIFFLLSWRAGISFCLSALIIFLMPTLSPALILLIIVFPQSSCSFWPFAHMSAVDSLEEKENTLNSTFNTKFALSVLACSLPFSTIIILGIFSFQAFFLNGLYVGILGLLLISISIWPVLINKLKFKVSKNEKVREVNFFTRLVEDIESRKAS